MAGKNFTDPLGYALCDTGCTWHIPAIAAHHLLSSSGHRLEPCAYCACPIHKLKAAAADAATFKTRKITSIFCIFIIFNTWRGDFRTLLPNLTV